jgi:hypothetical protein
VACSAKAARSSGPHSTVSDMGRYDGLPHASEAVPCNLAETTQADDGGGDDQPTSMGRSLQNYAILVEGAPSPCANMNKTKKVPNLV